MVEVLSAEREGAFWAGVESASGFFTGEADVQRALERLARILADTNIPYAIIGGMAGRGSTFTPWKPQTSRVRFHRARSAGGQRLREKLAPLIFAE